MLKTDAYIWQMRWLPSVSEAVLNNADIVDRWRILAGVMNVRGEWRSSLPDWTTLAKTTKPLTVVFRIEGQLARFDDAILVGKIKREINVWKDHGLLIEHLEIDFDCATSRLADYSKFLKALRHLKPSIKKISITVLPTWLESPALDQVLAAVDESVLQVHAVQNPRTGLFNPQQAYIWMAAFAERSKRPWQVALPTYGSRVLWNSRGEVTAIESEQVTLVNKDNATELFIDPKLLQAFVQSIKKRPYQNLDGIVWFRLPTKDDRRAWGEATWRSVILNQSLQEMLSVKAYPTDDANLYDIVLHNAGSIDVALPSLIRLDHSCEVGDGIKNYVFERQFQNYNFRRVNAGLLHAGEREGVGWIRCSKAGVSLEIKP